MAKIKQTALKQAPHRIYSVCGAARILGLSEASVRRLTRDGTLPCSVDQSGKRLFTQTQLDDFLKQRQAAK